MVRNVAPNILMVQGALLALLIILQLSHGVSLTAHTSLSHSEALNHNAELRMEGVPSVANGSNVVSIIDAS
jgi:hypothetical protein